MSNFSENENPAENLEVGESGAENGADEASTVFGNPSEHKKKAPKKQKKSRILIAGALLLAVAVLVVGTFAVIKLIPEKEDETTSSSELFPTIEVAQFKSDDFKSVTVKNINGVFKFYSEKVVKEETESSSGSTEEVGWYLEGYDRDIISSSTVASIASAAASITASREITEKTAAECGLDTPPAEVDVITGDGGEFSIIFGNPSPDNTGTYMKLSTVDKIYIVDDSFANTFVFDVLSLAENETVPGITITDDMADYMGEDGSLKTFDTLTVSGKNFPEKVVISANTTASKTVESYMVVSPMKRLAAKTSELLDAFKTGIAVSGVYSLDVTSASIKRFGLDNPDFVAEIKIAGHSRTFKYKLQEDGNYAVMNDESELIQKSSEGNLPYINYTTTDFYANWVCIQPIDSLSNFTIKTPEKTYSFDIVLNESDESGTTYTITCDGKTINESDFKLFYQNCIGLTCCDFTDGSVSGEPVLSIVFTYKDTSNAPTVVDFWKATETKYQYSVDGVQMGKITSLDFNQLLKNTEKIVNP